MSELVVRISADVKKLTDGYNQAAKETEALQGRLTSIAKTAGVAFAGLTAGIGLSIAAYKKAAIEDKKLAAAIEATGGAAGYTFDELKKMGDELAVLTGIEDETVTASQALLLTFNKISGESFPKALSIASDLSVLLGTDLKSATLQVGKALQDPIEGLGALSRVGIRFTEDQKSMIEALVRTGQVAEAQTLILDALNARVGGLAESSQKGNEGLNTLSKTSGDFVENIGAKFAPILNAAALALGNFFQFLNDNPSIVTFIAYTTAAATAIAGLVAALATAGVAFLTWRTAMAAIQAVNIAGYFTGIGASFASMASTILGIIPNLIRGVIAFGAAINTSLVGAFKAIPTAILQAQFVMGVFIVQLKAAAVSAYAFAGSLLTSLPAAIKAAIGGLVTLGSSIFTTTNLLAAMRIGLNLLVGATGIGLIIVVLSTLLFSWESTWKGIKDITFASIEAIKGILGGLGDVLVGVFTFDTEKISKGWEQIKDATVKGVGDVVTAAKEVAGIKIDASPEIASEGTEKLKAEEEKKTLVYDEETKKRLAIAQNALALQKLQSQEASDEEIEFTKRRQELIAREEEAGREKVAAIRSAELETIRLEKEQLILEEEEYYQKRAVVIAQAREEQAALDEELRALDVEQRQALNEEDLEALRSKVMTEYETEKAIAEKSVSDAIDRNNRKLMDQKRFGTAYAQINSLLHSEEVKGAAAAADQLVALQNSKNNTLKGIGKAAALTQIAISTAQGAISAYASLAPIPFVGPALGIAAAAALTAFGIERAATVMAAADGGILTGGTPGKDSIPVLGMPGELVVPTKNFEEVVGAVRNERAGGSADMSGVVSALAEISSKLDNVGNTIFQGDVLADDVYIDRLVAKIQDGLDNRNLQLRTT